MNEAVAEFANAASRYCAWCASTSTSEVGAARAALEHVSHLYRLALRLREHGDAPEADGGCLSHDQWLNVYHQIPTLPFGYYTSVFDPRDIEGNDSQAGMGDVADDLADIYRDLNEGLHAFRAGVLDAAEHAWASSFRIHWGRHAASALYALHCWFADESAW